MEEAEHTNVSDIILISFNENILTQKPGKQM
jgi:hypothetical protein